MKACIVPGCTAHSRRKSGHCDTHHQRVLRGLPLDTPVRRYRTEAWGRVKQAAEDYARATTTDELTNAEHRLADAAKAWAWEQGRA